MKNWIRRMIEKRIEAEIQGAMSAALVEGAGMALNVQGMLRLGISPNRICEIINKANTDVTEVKNASRKILDMVLKDKEMVLKDKQ